jgi:hypothetical protein
MVGHHMPCCELLTKIVADVCDAQVLSLTGGTKKTLGPHIDRQTRTQICTQHARADRFALAMLHTKSHAHTCFCACMPNPPVLLTPGECTVEDVSLSSSTAMVSV